MKSGEMIDNTWVKKIKNTITSSEKKMKILKGTGTINRKCNKQH